jgi:hypothetical protein
MDTASLHGQNLHNLSKTEVDRAAAKAQLKQRELYPGKEGSVTIIMD